MSKYEMGDREGSEIRKEKRESQEKGVRKDLASSDKSLRHPPVATSCTRGHEISDATALQQDGVLTILRDGEGGEISTTA